MSHFTVLIPARNDRQLNDRLAPFYEQYYPGDDDFENAFKKGWVVFDDQEEVIREEYNGGDTIIPIVELPDGSRYSRHDKRFQVQNPEREFRSTQYELPEGAKELDVEPHEFYDTFEEYADDYHGFKIGERMGYWHNPQAQWDWWSVGGRWTGSLHLKMDNGRPKSAQNGTPGVFGTTNDDDNRADTALVKDIDFDSMREEDIAYRSKRWKALHAGLDVAEKLETMTAVAKESVRLNKKKYPASDITISSWISREIEHWNRNPEKSHDIWPTELDYARHSLAQLIAKEDDDVEFFMESYDTMRELNLPYDKYMENYKTPAATFAFIDTEGNWNERGSMGWWGMVSDRQPDYDNAWWEFVNSLPDDQRVYIVDCHI